VRQEREFSTVNADDRAVDFIRRHPGLRREHFARCFDQGEGLLIRLVASGRLEVDEKGCVHVAQDRAA
jgi:hypothetical protein